MRAPFYAKWSAVVALLIVFSSCKKHLPSVCDCRPDDYVGIPSVFATGLNDPRGLKFGPDGNLYVAEGGIGGSDSSTNCVQVVPPVGPYKGSATGSRISMITGNGTRTTYVDSLPSSQTALGEISGVADVSFLDNTLYALLAGAGCSHGVPSMPNGIIKVNSDKTWSLLADLSAFQASHPTKVVNEGDFEPDGSWYSMATVGGNLYALEPNHGELDRVSPAGNIERVVDISASQGHIVPTAMVFHNGSFYVGNLDVFPITGKSKILKISMAGDVQVVDTGFSTILGVAFDRKGALYVLENTTGAGNQFPTPGTGDIVRIDPSGTRKTIVTGLNLPTAMTFGPDEKLYVSNWGFGKGPGGGEILKVDITCGNGDQQMIYK
jgi:hypothetical protein